MYKNSTCMTITNWKQEWIFDFESYHFKFFYFIILLFIFMHLDWYYFIYLFKIIHCFIWFWFMFFCLYFVGVAGRGWLTCCSWCMWWRVTRLRGRALSSLFYTSFLSHQHHVSSQNSKVLACLCMLADFFRPAIRVVEHKALCMCVSSPCFVCLGLFS